MGGPSKSTTRTSPSKDSEKGRPTTATTRGKERESFDRERERERERRAKLSSPNMLKNRSLELKKSFLLDSETEGDDDDILF